MNQFFDYNNNVFRVLGGLADCLILGALWIVCSLFGRYHGSRHSGGVPCGQ